MERCFYKWSIHQDKNDKCIIVIGDIPIKHDDKTIELAELLIHMASPYYILYEKYYDPIPEYKKQIKGSSSIKQETVIVLERKE